MVDTETATATLTGTTDIATYVELFAELEKPACFGDEAVQHLERIAGRLRRLRRGPAVSGVRAWRRLGHGR
ncbi:hypothetical protein [Nocardiopsis sp. JB363]|uniref:hypothetical protein n=1 Tax=Nocardiopsis sp. JB363 TaxID=1434837 RepID=UPI00097B955F|nr:hypothetical protein [Nocardiopsis sp. JB363]SIO85558.1 hypothetical protein BQ8420_07560 [Nocardiopsis sp. JB363]